jgi:hypothetical protein
MVRESICVFELVCTRIARFADYSARCEAGRSRTKQEVVWVVLTPPSSRCLCR